MKLHPTNQHRTSKSDAFSRRELLAVVAVVLLIGCVQFPLLGRSHSGDKAAHCRNNLRQLILAWQMFSSDNHGRITPNHGDVGEGGAGETQKSWASGWLDFSSSYDNINTDYLVNNQKNGQYGMLGPYLKGPEVFRCPSDTGTTVIFRRQLSRVRSVSMNNWMGGTNFNGQTSYRVFVRQSDISGLSPAEAWVIQEEREDSINDSRFEVDMQDNLAAYPASYHHGGGFLSYADGHVSHRVWQDPRTNPELVKGTLLPLNVQSPNNPDLDWLRARSTVAE